MALTVLQLQAKRDELVKALGIEVVRTGENSITYREIEKAIAAIDREIAKASGRTSRRTVATFSNGLT
jgi:ribosome-associated translation inhibitor RaiA